MKPAATKGPKAFAAGLGSSADWREAVAAASAQAKKGLGGRPCDLALVFASALYADLEPQELARTIASALAPRTLLGCNASGVLAGEREIEFEPAVAVLAMSLPGVRIHPFALSAAETRSFKTPAQLLETLDLYPSDRPKFLALADPMTCDIERWLALFNEAFPGEPVLGGLASGPAIGRPSWLALDDEPVLDGSAGVALCGDVELESVVAQGCRPIGEPLIITKADGHVVYELGGKPPLEVLRLLLDGLPPEDRELARTSLFAGLVMNEYRSGFKRGDFLVRNLLGSDTRSGALMVGAGLKAGQTLQFQLRDKRTSAEDLRDLLGALSDAEGARGALLVSCCGRGKGLYGEEGHDSRLIQSLKGPLPLAGFFANGEIGPVAGRNHIHGYTSSLAVLR